LIVQIKDNQPNLREKAEAVAAEAEPVDVETTTNRGRNRDETRKVAVFDARDAVAGTEWQDHVAAIIMVTRTVHRRNSKTGLWDTTADTACYLSSEMAPATVCAHAIRSHWAIENSNHYPRDVTFGEDASRIRDNPGVFARLRSFAYNILRINKSGSFVQGRFRAALGGVEGLLAFTVA
jgi:predicted transposase YbfD/YdcC